MEIIPGILEKNWEAIAEKIELVRPFAKTIHIDLIDGKFVNHATHLDPTLFTSIAADFFLELHMMVDEPIGYLEAWAKAGFRRFLGHVESMSDQAAFVAKGQLLGEVGLALDGPTPVSRITVPLSDLDVLLIYTSEKVGFSGPPFDQARLSKIEEVRRQTDRLPIEVDGGITPETLPQAMRAGANRFVSTSFLFKTCEPEKQFSLLSARLPLDH